MPLTEHLAENVTPTLQNKFTADKSDSREIHEKDSHEIIDRLIDARHRSNALFDLVRPDSLYERPIPERHRIIFYVGHLEAFDWNLLSETLGLRSGGPKTARPEFDRLFAFGIDPVGGGLPTDQPSDWPSLDEVENYVAAVRNALDEALANTNIDQAEGRDGFPLHTLLNVAIEHRLMHVETLAYMLHQLPFDMKVRPADSPTVQAQTVRHDMASIPAGKVTLGLPRSGKTFGWDNEFEADTVDVPSFEIDRYKVTNRQYLEFMAADGYENCAFWTDHDWNWKEAHGVSHPAFWTRKNDCWYWRTMFREIPFDEVPLSEISANEISEDISSRDAPSVLDWPVYVSQAEASAYARWIGKSLPAEAEWQRAAYGTTNYGTTTSDQRRYPWGSEAPSAKLGNFDFQYWDPTPVTAFPDGQSSYGVHDLLGNGWEWTSTVFGPLPGFQPFPFYRGYSADFFDGKHFVMKGGSSRTAACMLRPSFRNWFQAHYQYVYAGFRCVRR